MLKNLNLNLLEGSSLFLCSHSQSSLRLKHGNQTAEDFTILQNVLKFVSKELQMASRQNLHRNKSLAYLRTQFKLSFIALAWSSVAN